MLGREVTTLINEEESPGNYEVQFDGTSLPSGVYFYTLNANEFFQSKKMLLIK
ncbi:MAG: T9SS type A sorting domain-containing protein [Bacteroidetes bacterium]|nr:T9SS type A sorting domain-containing protein [Bacteroidota bacterium]